MPPEVNIFITFFWEIFREFPEVRMSYYLERRHAGRWRIEALLLPSISAPTEIDARRALARAREVNGGEWRLRVVESGNGARREIA
jgi:hypothetical protein